VPLEIDLHSLWEVLILNYFSQSLSKMPPWFIKKLTDLFNGDLSQFQPNDAAQPLASLIVPTSSGFSSPVTLGRLEKIVCKNFNQKKIFNFNHSRVLLAKTHPNSPEAKSLFDRMVEEIPTSALIALKCKNAPWRVILVIFSLKSRAYL
jgi:hypothetical protein